MGKLHRLLLPWQIWGPLWRQRQRWNGWFMPACMVLLIGILLGLPYAIINRVMSWTELSVIDLTTPLDNAIPFVGWMIIPYASLYFFYPAGAIIAPKSERGRRELIALYQNLFIVSWLVFLVFIFLPTEVTIREQIPLDLRNGGGVWGWAYGASLHKTDMPWNAWPSLHIIQSMLIALTVNYWWKGNGTKGLFLRQLILWILWILLSVSILFTKQHFVFDLISGVIVGILAWKYMLKPSLEWASSSDAKAYTAKWDV